MTSDYTFADLIRECESLDKVHEVDYNSPEVLNSQLRNRVAGTSIDLVIIVYPYSMTGLIDLALE